MEGIIDNPNIFSPSECTKAFSVKVRISKRDSENGTEPRGVSSIKLKVN